MQGLSCKNALAEKRLAFILYETSIFSGPYLSSQEKGPRFSFCPYIKLVLIHMGAGLLTLVGLYEVGQ